LDDLVLVRHSDDANDDYHDHDDDDFDDHHNDDANDGGDYEE
jgi:hypothetical protein